jgi:hypothetical protein
MSEVFTSISDIIAAGHAALRALIPHFDAWCWLALLIASIVLGIKHVIAHMRNGRLTIGEAVIGSHSHTDASGASVFRSAKAVQRRPSLSPFYGRPAWLRAVPYPVLVTAAWLWVYLRPVAVLAAVAVLGWIAWRLYRACVSWSHRRSIVVPMTQALGPALEVQPREVLQGIVVPRNYHNDDAKVIVPLPDHHRPMHVSEVGRIVAERLGGEWNARRVDGGAPYRVMCTHKPAPPSHLSTADVAEWILEPGHRLTPFIGLGTERSVLRLDFGGQTVHVALSAGTGAGKSTLIRLVTSQLVFNGIYDMLGIDAKGTSFDGVRHVPGIEIHDDIEDDPDGQWDAVARARQTLYDRSRGKRHGNASWDPKFIILEEFNVTSRLWKKRWTEVKDKNDPATPPPLSNLEDILYMGREFEIFVIVVCQRLGANLFSNNNADGGALRGQFGNRMLARYDRQAYEALVDSRNRVPCPEIPGRWLIAKQGNPRQVQIPNFTVEDSMQLIRAGRDNLTPVSAGHVPPAVPSRAGRLPYEINSPQGDTGDGDSPDPAGANVVYLSGRQNHSQSLTESLEKLRPAEPEIERYTIRQACEEGILPASYDTVKRRRSRLREKGLDIPGGIQDGRSTLYTAEELRDWWDGENENEKQTS